MALSLGAVKRILLSIAGIILLVTVFARCSVGEGPSRMRDVSGWMQESGKPKVLATTSIVYDVVHQVAKDHIDLLLLIPSEMDPHSYELVKDDDTLMQRADVVFANGLGLEHGASLDRMLHTKDQVVFLGNAVLKENPKAFIYVNGQLDPHIWMDLDLWSGTVDPVVAELKELLPQYADEFEENGGRLKEAYSRADHKILTSMQSIPAVKRYLVTSHDAFNYYARRYLATPSEKENHDWRVRVRAIQGIAPDEQLSSSEIREVVHYVLKHRVCVIFAESNLSRDGLRKVVDACQKSGVDVALSKKPLYGDTLGGMTLTGMVESNTQIIEEGFIDERCD